MIRKHFTTGLAILLPGLFTILILGFLVNLLTKPFLPTTEIFLTHYDLFTQPFFFLQSHDILRTASKILILLCLMAFIAGVGFFGQLFLVNYLFKLSDAILHRMPYINKIYKACKDIVNSLFSTSSKSFSQVVFVPYPALNTLSLGFVTQDKLEILQKAATQEVIPVFIPAAPNASAGFILMFKKEEITLVNMSVEAAMKFIVSCGAVDPNFQLISKQPNEP